MNWYGGAGVLRIPQSDDVTFFIIQIENNSFMIIY